MSRSKTIGAVEIRPASNSPFEDEDVDPIEVEASEGRKHLHESEHLAGLGDRGGRAIGPSVARLISASPVFQEKALRLYGKIRPFAAANSRVTLLG
ncbi:MAG: hypothetical protein NZ700_09745 [Gemmataceae bacterium]|nr:hypothetical protein [Gemmataceae bacterium]MDW8266904.1 hypothetical protein [Gemmataceae bacterium]